MLTSWQGSHTSLPRPSPSASRRRRPTLGGKYIWKQSNHWVKLIGQKRFVYIISWNFNFKSNLVSKNDCISSVWSTNWKLKLTSEPTEVQGWEKEGWGESWWLWTPGHDRICNQSKNIKNKTSALSLLKVAIVHRPWRRGWTWHENVFGFLDQLIDRLWQGEVC